MSPDDSAIREMLSNELMLWAEYNAKLQNSDEAVHLMSELDALRPLQSEQDEQQRQRRIAVKNFVEKAHSR